MASALPPRHQTRPIGNEYLQVRAEVGTALFALGALAQETGASAATLQTIQGLQAGLREPLRFVVVGELKAGKSSLLNALFGREFCRTDVLPASDCTQVFRYGEPARDVVVSAALVERFQPIPFLRDFIVVDTPGTNPLIAEHEVVTETFLPQSDLVLFVLSAANPWSGSAWELLERLQQRWLKNVVLVLQQADLREPGEIEIIVQHLRQTATQRFGQALPVFAVSAKMALLAKTSGVDKERLWTESRFGELEAYVNNTLGSQGENARRFKLRSVAGTARAMLQELAAAASDAGRATAGDREGLDRLREEMARWKKGSQGQVQGLLRGLEGVFDRCRDAGEHELAGRLRFWPAVRHTVFGRDREWEAAFGRDEEARLREALRPELERALGAMEEDLRHVGTQAEDALRSHLRPEAHAHLVAPARAGEEPGARRTRLSEQIELTLVERLGDAGTGVMAGRALGQRQRTLAAYRARWESKRQELSNAVGDLMFQAIDGFYRHLAQRVAPVEAFVGTQEERLRPLLERITSLERQFGKVAGRL